MFRMRILILMTLLSVAMAGTSQTAQPVMLEHFTNASCTACQMVNSGFNAFTSQHADSLVVLNYHTSWPGIDPLNTGATSVVGARAAYYGVSVAPILIANGSEVATCDGYWDGAPACYGVSNLASQYVAQGDFDITISAGLNVDLNVVSILVHVIAHGEQAGDHRLRVVMAESAADFCTSQGSNGDTHFEHIVRGMATTTLGEDLPDLIADGTDLQYLYTVSVPSGFVDVTKMEIVAFVQDDNDKSIKQVKLQNVASLGYDMSMRGCSSTISQCDNTYIIPGITATSNGAIHVNNITLNASVNGSVVYTGDYSAGFNQGQSHDVLNGVTLNLSNGLNEIKVWASSIDGQSDDNTVNDIWTQHIIVNSNSVAGGLFESFGNSASLPSEWQIVNPSTTANTWQYASSSYDAIGGSFMLPLYYIPAGEQHELIIERHNLAGTDSIDFTFSVAKGQYYFHYDTLEVHASNDCGATWNRIWMKGEPTLGTTSPSYSLYAAADSADWRNETIAKSVLAPYFPFENMMFKFVCRSDFGNTLFLDNIRINQYGVGVEEISAQESVRVYPNPANQMLSVQIPTSAGKASIIMYDLTGRVVYRDQANSGSVQTLNLDNLSNGVYTLTVGLDGKQTSTKVVVQH